MGVISKSKTATIANGQTTSDAVNCGDKPPVMLRMPAAFTGTSLTFQGSQDGVTFQEIDAGGSAYSVTVAASKDIALDPLKFGGARFIKLVSGSAEGADRAVIVVCSREFYR